jgi:uncharacterized protein with NRDE domain
MCVAAIAWRAHPRWRLVVVGNRDEFRARPTAPLSVWPDGRIIAGRDLQAGGTWLGVAPGRFALVTNYRVEGYPLPHLASRGALVTDWLRGNEPGDVATMNPFNLWTADADELAVLTNYPEPSRKLLAPGIHGLSNGAHDRRWFKTAQLETALADWLESGHDPAQLLAPLAERDIDPAALDRTDGPIPEFSSVFIASPEYGTRCSTVIAIAADLKGTIIERSFDADAAATGTVSFDFDWAV